MASSGSSSGTPAVSLASSPTYTPVSSSGAALLTTTRTLLRRDIARALGEPFLRDMAAGYSSASGGTTTTLVDSDLAYLWDGQERKGMWLYVATGDNAGEERRVLAYTAATGTFTCYPAFPYAIDAGDQYEIHWRTSASEKHRAIERALRGAFPSWFLQQEAEIILCRDAVEIDAALGLPSDIREPLALYLEPSHDGSDWTATGGTSLSVTVSGQSWTDDEYAGYSASFYDGQGRAQRATVSSNDADTLTFVSALDIAPAEGSRFRLAAPAERSDWWQIEDATWGREGAAFARLWLPYRLQGNEGRALRLRYLSDPALLADDESQTEVPHEWIVAEAVLRLLRETPDPSRVPTVPITQEELYYQRGLIRDWEAQAREARDRLRWPYPRTTHWQPSSMRQGGARQRWGSGRFFDGVR